MLAFVSSSWDASSVVNYLSVVVLCGWVNCVGQIHKLYRVNMQIVWSFSFSLFENLIVSNSGNCIVFLVVWSDFTAYCGTISESGHRKKVSICLEA